MLALRDDLTFVSQDGQVPLERVAAAIAEGRVYLAAVGDHPMGFTRVELLWGKLPYLALVFVLRDQRCRGVGRAMLASIERDARAAGQAYLYSSSQADEPEPQAWDGRMGFTECGFIAGINPGGVGEVFFRKALASSP